MDWVTALPPFTSIVVIGLAAVLMVVALVFARSGWESRGRNRRVSRAPAIRAATAPPVRTVAVQPMVSYAEIKQSYDSAHARWKEWDRKLSKRIQLLESRQYESMSPKDLLYDASLEERGNLAALLGCPPDTPPAGLLQELRSAGSHSVATWVRGEPVPYQQVVVDVAAKLGAPRPKTGADAVDVEHAAIGAVFEQILAKATPEQRAAILADISRSQVRDGKKAGVVAGGLVVAHLSGFGLYMAASSTLAAVTGVIGATLPFAVYTGMSSVLATLTGPIGWAALATWAVAKMGSPAYKKTIPAVLAIATTRARLLAERDQELESLVADRDGPLDSEARRLARLANFLEQMRKSGSTTGVPASSIPKWCRV